MGVIALDSVAELRAASADVCHEIFAPPSTLTVSEWADENRELPPTSAEPGRFRTDRIPYLRKIQDTLGDETVHEVVFAKSAQVAGTTVGENFIGYLVDQAACGILQVWPTEKAIRAFSTKRLKPMLRDTLCLRARLPRSGRRDSADSMASKDFAGGASLQLLTAKSTADLRSHSARVAIGEEIDDWEGDVGDQGDPLELLRARSRTFWNWKLYLVSTPTIAGFSRIWAALEASTWNEYWVPCPSCRHMRRLVWRDEAGTYRLLFERDAGGALIPGTSRYVCEACDAAIEERWKPWMLEHGEWRERYPGRSVVGFHVNTLYSPLTPWDEVGIAFLRAKDSPEKLQTFDNTWLGIPYEERGEKIDAHWLEQRAEPFGRTDERPWDIPIGVGVLTAGVDVQGDRLEAFLWGVGAGYESWALRWDVLEGDPGHDPVWVELLEWLTTPWKQEAGASVRIAAAAIDAGYQTERVHRFTDAYGGGGRVIPTVGRDGLGRRLLVAPGPEKYRQAGAKKKRPTYVLGVDAGKTELASRLRKGQPGPGYVHFSELLDRAFYDQLTSEKLVTRYRRKRAVRVWEKLPGRANEALDGAIAAMGALQHLVNLGVLSIAKLGELAEQLTAAGASAPPPPPRPVRRIRHRGLEGW